ncbi:MAG: hypothetical protein QOJ45_293 [Verrucomicrobiota bacterium]
MAIRELILGQRCSDHSWSEQLRVAFRGIPTAPLSARFGTGPKTFEKNLGSASKSHNRLFIKSLRHNPSNFRPVGLAAVVNCVISRSRLLTCVPGIRGLITRGEQQGVYQAPQTPTYISGADDNRVNFLSQRQLLIEKRPAAYQEGAFMFGSTLKNKVRRPFWRLRRLVISRIRRVSNNLQFSEALTQVLYCGGGLVKVAQAGLVRVKHLRFLLRICAHQLLGGDCSGLVPETALAGVKVSSPRQLVGMGQPSNWIFVTSLSPIGQAERLRIWVSVETTYI